MTQLFFVTGISEAEVESKTSEALNKLHSWADANSLRINPSKTQILLYLPKGKKISRPLKIALNSQPIELVTSVKTLGVIFSHNLTWNAHIEHICSKVSSALGILGRFRHIFPVRVKMLLYNALVLSHIQYCSLVWGTTGVTNLHRLHLLQKKAVRSIANVPFLFPTRNIFIKYDILPIFALYFYRLLLCYKYSSQQRDNPFIVLGQLRENNSCRNTRYKETWITPTPRTYSMNQSLSYNLPLLLNKLIHDNFDITRNSKHNIRDYCRDNFNL